MADSSAKHIAGWASLIVAPLAWAVHHQLGSNFAFAACERGSARLAALAGAVLLLIVLASGWRSWRMWRRAGGDSAQDHEALERFVPLLGWMSAVLFALPIAVQLIADLLVPPCFG
jgi:hypothetical protein